MSVKQLFLLGLLFASAAAAAQNSKDRDRLRSITSHYYADYIALNPLAATSCGAKGYDDKMEINISDGYINASIRFNHRYLDSLKKVNVKPSRANLPMDRACRSCPFSIYNRHT